MSRRDRDNSRHHDQRGRSTERSSSHYSSSRNDGRSQFSRPRHQQTSQVWQSGNYQHSASYNSNYQYQNRPRQNSSNYNHNNPWNQQWGGYNSPYPPSQWGLSNQQQASSQSFTPHCQLPSYVTHETQPQESGLRPTGNPKTSKTSTSQNPPLGSKEYRERALEESKDRLKKSLRESLDRSPSNLDGNDDNSVDQLSTTTPDSDRSGPRPRTALVKTVRDSDKVGVCINASSSTQKQIRRSSSDSNNRISPEGINPPKSSTSVNRRSRSTSLSSSTNNASAGTITANKQVLQSSVGSKGQTSKEVQAAKQRVIKELLSMNRVKLKELVSYPRSRKIDMVMKYMIKESRAQQSHKQRQLAQAGMVGTQAESSNSLAQQDVEALLSDPDLHISLSNLPTEVIETLGNIFKLNSLEDVESVDPGTGMALGESTEGLSRTETNELDNTEVSNDLGIDSADVGLHLDGSIKLESKLDDVEMFYDVKPDVDLALCKPTGRPIDTFSSGNRLSDVGPSLETVEASRPSSRHNLILETQTDCDVSMPMTSSYSEDTVALNKSSSIQETPISINSPPLELTDDIEKMELLTGLSPLTPISKPIPISQMEPVDNLGLGLLIDPIQESTCPATLESVTNILPPKQICETFQFPQQSQSIASDIPKEVHATSDVPNPTMILEPLEVSEDILVAHNSQENTHRPRPSACDNSHNMLGLNSSLETINTVTPDTLDETNASSETLENTTLGMSSSEQINMTPEPIADSYITVSKDLESSRPSIPVSSSIATNLSDTYIALSESNAKNTETVCEEENSRPSTTTPTFEVGLLGIGVPSEQNIMTTDAIEAYGMESENLEHDQASKISLDLPVAGISGMPTSEPLDVKDQESVVELHDASTGPTHFVDVSIPESLHPECFEKITDASDLSPTTIISYDASDSVENGLNLAQDITSTKEKTILEYQEEAPNHKEKRTLSPEPIINQHSSCDKGKIIEPSALEPMLVESEKTVGHEMGSMPMDPMCILYESLDVISSRHSESQPFDIGLGLPKHTGEHDIVSTGMATECGLLSDMENIQVKSEREDVHNPTLYDHTPCHHNEDTPIFDPLEVPGTEVSTQTEHFPNTTTNLTDMLQLFKASCENPSQEAAFNQLKELFMTKTANVDDSEPPTRCTQIKSIQQKRRSNSRRHGPTKQLHRPTTAVSTSGQLAAFPSPRNLSDPLLDSTVSEVDPDLHTRVCTTPDLDQMGPQEKLKSLFHNITLIENKIETWMEIKKKLYEKVNNILEDEKSQCSSSSRHGDTSMVEVTSSSTEQITTRLSTLSNQLHKPTAMKEVSTPKTRKNVHVSKSTPIMNSPTLLTREPRRVAKNPTVTLVKTTCLVENMDSSFITQSKVKKETLHSNTSTDESPVLSKSKSKRRRQFGQKKRKVINSRASLSTRISNDKPLSSTSPPVKRSSRNKSNLGEKIDEELLKTTISEESNVRCSRRNIDKVSPVLVPADKDDESPLKNRRRRVDKEIPLPAVSNIPDHDSSRINRRTRRCQANDANDEAIELCIISPNLSRRTKGERKEISAPTELQNLHAGGCSPRRATRQSLNEPIVIEDLTFPEVKRAPKRKAHDRDNVDEPHSLPLINTIRNCSVVLEPLGLHINKKRKYSTLDDQSSGDVKKEPEVSECEDQNESQMEEPNLGTDITSDEDDMPLFKIKQSMNPNITAESNIITKLLNDADHNSVSSSDTALDQGIDDNEIGGDFHNKSKRNKSKKSKKEKLYDHHSRNENLEFVDHNRGTILDIKIVGRHLLAASEDGFLYSYSMKSGKLKKTYEGHQAAVTCVCTIDGEKESEKSCPEKVVTGSLDDNVRCYLFKSAELIHAPLKIGTALCVDYNWGIVYLGTKLGEVAKVNAKTFTLIGDHMKFSSESILALKATKEGPRKVLIIGTRDQPIAIRDADSGLFLRTVSGEWHHTVCSLLLDKSLVYCGTMSGPIPVFDFTNGQEMFRLQAGVGVRCVKIYHNLLFAGCYDGNIYIYNVKDQALIHTISGSGKMVLCLDITKNKVIYSCKDALKSMNFPPEVSRALKEGKLK